MNEMTKASELREMSDEHLALTLKEAPRACSACGLQAQTERLDAPSELRKAASADRPGEDHPDRAVDRGGGEPASERRAGVIAWVCADELPRQLTGRT